MKPTRPNGHERVDIHVIITDQIVAAIEAGAGEFKMPWHRAKGSLMRPVNIATGNAYQGINILALWVAAESRGYEAPVWGTFKQWLDRGHPVRKGEKSVTGVFYKDLLVADTDDATGETNERKIGMARAFPLFNCAQVEGFVAPEETFTPSQFDANARVEALIQASGVAIAYGGDRAYYNRTEDRVQTPEAHRFTGTDTMTAAEAYDATRLHELLHWSGAPSRLDREFGKRFGDKAYAFEELIAELGASYLCVQLGVSPIARPDHAQYLAGWLKVLKEDKKAIFTAASQAERAARYLMAFAPDGPDDDLGPEHPTDAAPDQAPPKDPTPV